MFTHNINPVFLQLGPLEIRYYGLVYFIGFLFVYFFFKYLIKNEKISSLSKDNLDLFMIYFMLGAILGARILDFVFFNTGILFTDPLEIIKIWHGGMSIHGGIIGAVVGAYIFARKHKAEFYELADYIIIPLMVFLGIGRIANFINGELSGTQSTGKFCIDYSQNQYISNPPSGCRHPYTIYESIKNFGVALILIAIKAKTTLKKGLLFWYGIFLYNVLRFFVDIYRDANEPNILLGLSMTQLLCIIFALISGIWIYLLSKRNKNLKEAKEDILLSEKSETNSVSSNKKSKYKKRKYKR
jgi:phosphatidylglycerol---prolipoprotein diacylglyceryl transferase